MVSAARPGKKKPVSVTGLKAGWRLYRQIFVYVSGYARLMWLAIFLSLFLSLTSGFATYSFLPVFSLVFENQANIITGSPTNNQAEDTIATPWQKTTARLGERANSLLSQIAGQGTVMNKLWRLVVFISVLSAVSTGLSLAVDYIFIKIQAAGVKQLRQVVFKHISYLPMSYLNKERVGFLISRVENDVGGTISLVAKSMADVILHGFTILTYLVLLLFINYQLVFLLFPTLAVIGIFAVIIGRWIKKTRKKILELQSQTVALLQEFLSGIRVVKLFVAEKYEQSRWAKYAARGYGLEITGSLNKILPARLTEVLVVVVTSVIMLAGGWLITHQRATVAEFLVFFILLIRFQRPLSGLVNVWWNVQNGLAFAERVTKLLADPVEEDKGTIRPPVKDKTVNFEGVSFSYGEEVILQDINFSLPPGKLVALIGPSGAGKSSIVDLLLRLYNPTSGQITLNGRNIREFSLSEYRALFGVVTQDTYLFHDTVARNILYAVPKHVSQAEMIAAAKAAHIHEFINDLPQGYDTLVGERGVRFSGGQRQRIALARALVRQPSILVLDEATSSLDSQSESYVQKAIDDMVRGRTTFVIAHRLSTVRAADVILVLNEGKIVQTGTHDDLTKNDGLYRHLWLLQTQTKAN